MKHAMKEKNKRLGKPSPEIKPQYKKTFELVGQSWLAEDGDSEEVDEAVRNEGLISDPPTELSRTTQHSSTRSQVLHLGYLHMPHRV